MSFREIRYSLYQISSDGATNQPWHFFERLPNIWSGGGKYEVNAIYVGYMMYATIATQLDLPHVIGIISRFICTTPTLPLLDI